MPRAPCSSRRLHEHRRRQGDLRETDPHFDLVFAKPDGSPADARNILNRHLKPAAAAAGIEADVTLYLFRHGFGTRLMERTKDPTSLRDLMGHSTTRTGMDNYDHPSQRRLRETSSAMEIDLEDLE